MQHYGTAFPGNANSAPAANQGVLNFQNVANGVIASNGANLHVAPIGTISTSFLTNGNVGIGTTTPLERFQLGDRFTFSDGGWKGIASNIAWSTSLNTTARIVAAPSSGIYFTELGNILFQTAPTGAAGTALSNAIHSLVIHNSGQVGIGTSYTKTGFSDLNYKLFVEGAVRARKVTVDQVAWPDYVFENNYSLPSLAEVERFIQLHKHLPGVPSAKEVETDGLDLGSNQAILLKKIEELTLYSIEQDKKIKVLETENEKLKTSVKLIDELKAEIDNIKKMLKK
jgi:hypothetical protein